MQARFSARSAPLRNVPSASGTSYSSVPLPIAAGVQVAVLHADRPSSPSPTCRFEAARLAAVLEDAVDVQALVEPVAREPLAGPQLDVDLVALRVAVFVDERRVLAAVELLHGRVPAVRLGGPPAAPVVEGALVEQLRPASSSRPSRRPGGTRAACRSLPLSSGCLFEPALHGGHDLLDAGDLAVRLGEVVHQRRVEHVPGVVVEDLRARCGR